MRWAGLLATLICLGCTEAHAPLDAAPPGGGDDASVAVDAGPPDAGPPPPRPRALDLLLAVDGSNSVGEEQYSFIAALPGLLEALSTGDWDGDGVADAEPFDSIHVGVVSSDMGTGGATVPTCVEPMFGDDGVLENTGHPGVDGCQASYPRFLEHARGEDVATFALAAGCVASLGVTGCGFEQPLEGMLKAVSPATPTAWTGPDYVPPVFFADTRGHGDDVNAGFVRAGSLLAVLMMTDEDDCSASDPRIFDPASSVYGHLDLSRRCGAEGALYPVGRYVDGLVALRAHPSQVAFFPIAGLPEDLEPAPGAAIDWAPIVGDPSVRDPRLVPTVDPEHPTRDLPSCNVAGRGVAFAPTRLLDVAHDLAARGGRVGLGSVCRESFESSYAAFARLLLE